MVRKILNQTRTPVFTAISPATTAVVWVFLLTARFTNPGPFGGAAFVLFTGIVMFIGLAVNYPAGCIAYDRGEHWGGRIAVMGVALWVLTAFCPVKLR